MKRNKTEMTYRGAKWHATHQQSVDALIGRGKISVKSQGSQFLNHGRWTSLDMRERFLRLASNAVNWPASNPWTKKFVLKDLLGHSTPYIESYIQIASTPDELPRHTALALVGGAYHEALHSLWTRKEDLTDKEIKSLYRKRIEKLTAEEWVKSASTLRSLDNIIEDIRIERNGIKLFSGIKSKLEPLQDFILHMEDTSWQQTQPGPRAMFECIFRDLGLGYDTDRQRTRFLEYSTKHSSVMSLVQGHFAGFLKQAVSLGPTDSLASAMLAMDIVIELNKISQNNDDQQQQPQQSGSGDGDGEPQPGEQQPGSGSGKDSDDESDEPQDGQGNGSGEKDSDKEEKQDKDSSSGGSDESGEDKEEKDSGDGEDGEDGEDNGDDGGSGDAGDNPDADDAKESSNDKDDAPGQSSDNPAPTGSSGAEATSILDDQSKDGRKDFSSAMENAMEDLQGKTESNLMPYRPFDTSQDQFLDVEDRVQNRAADRVRAKLLLDELKSETSFLRLRLQNVIRGIRNTGVLRGVKQGRRLSDSFLVDTVLSVRGGFQPQRPYDVEEEQIDTAFCAAIVVDESSSMSTILEEARKVLFALAEPLDSLNIPTMILGFRDGKTIYNAYSQGYSYHDPTYTRRSGSIIDIFKRWGERLKPTMHRLMYTKAVRCTPMSDGIHVALKEIQDRPETHKIIFVITDGAPTGNHEFTVPWQIKKAKEAGIHIVGVGLGCGTEYVEDLFEYHVQSSTLSEIPKKLIKLLGSLLGLKNAYRQTKRAV